MTRLRNPAVRSRLRSIWDKLSPRARAAILALLGAGAVGGGVVVVDRDPPPPVDPPVIDEPRDEPTDPPPVDPPPTTSEWPATTSQQTLSWQDAVRLEEHTANVDFLATGPTDYQGKMVLLADYGEGLHEDYTLTDCLVRVAPNARRHWGLQVYDGIDWKIRRCEFLGQPGSEHGMYPRVPQGFLVEDCRFSGWGGAGIQVTFRRVWGTKYQHESSDHMLASVPSQHIYRRVTIEECGDPTSPRFGAYLLSEHAPEIKWPTEYGPDGEPTEFYVSHRIEADVFVEDCVIRGGNLDMVYKPNSGGSDQHIRSTRGLLVQQRPSLTVTNSIVDVPEPIDGWNSQIWAVDHVVLRDSEFNGGTIEIRWAKSVTIENCTGTAKVLVGGGQWNKWPATDVIHEAPITQDWSWSE